MTFPIPRLDHIRAMGSVHRDSRGWIVRFYWWQPGTRYRGYRMRRCKSLLQAAHHFLQTLITGNYRGKMIKNPVRRRPCNSI